MSLKLLRALAGTLARTYPEPSRQQPAPQPLQSMPYSPSLDVTSLDRSVDPCVDFLQIQLRRLGEKQPIPADQAGWSVYARLTNDNQQFLWGILEDDAKAPSGPSSVPRTPIQQKVGDYFAACMNTSSIDALATRPSSPSCRKLPRSRRGLTLLSALTRLHHEYAGSFSSVRVPARMPADSSTVIVEMRAAAWVCRIGDYYTKTDEKSVKIREQYAGFIQQLLALTGESAEQAQSRRRRDPENRNRTGQGLAHSRRAPRPAQHLPHGERSRSSPRTDALH